MPAGQESASGEGRLQKRHRYLPAAAATDVPRHLHALRQKHPGAVRTKSRQTGVLSRLLQHNKSKQVNLILN